MKKFQYNFLNLLLKFIIKIFCIFDIILQIILK